MQTVQILGNSPSSLHIHLSNFSCYLPTQNKYVFYVMVITLSGVLICGIAAGYVMIWHHLSGDKFDVQEPIETHMSAEQVSGAAIYTVLMSIAWISGPLTLRTKELPYEYVFAVTNCLSGVTLFVVRVLMYDEASAAWRQLVTDGTFRRYRGSPTPGNSAESTLTRAGREGSIFAAHSGIITGAHAFNKPTEPLASDIPRHVHRRPSSGRYARSRGVNFAEPLEYEEPPTPPARRRSIEHDYAMFSGHVTEL